MFWTGFFAILVFLAAWAALAIGVGLCRVFDNLAGIILFAVGGILAACALGSWSLMLFQQALI